MLSLAALATLFSIAAKVSAHSIFQQVYVNGVSQGHLTGIRVPDYDGPITDVTSNDVICNGGINPYHQPLPTTVIPVAAGSQVTAEWHHTLNGADPSDPADPIDASHKGPLIVYLAKVDSALQTTVTGLKWFKIYEDGLNPADQSWGVDRLIANKGKMTFTIPNCIPAGQYLMRVELIALHGASSYPGAQLYMECAQLQITGGGSTSPATVSFPGAYSGTDPGIKINIYQTLSSYTIPGPNVFTCSGSSGSSGSSGNTGAASTTVRPTTSAPVSTSAPSSTAASGSSSSSSGTAAQWAQCGGIGWTGATGCVSPFKCTVINPYYSQCT
ncbi:glycoside hydrolase family 61 protein I [Dendrothele bispora CBS 962.96]|uniref:AA9 family lytic polysaccharide monooxygenase n=1 Tax=Dendrothele bispora (strain CBS 962.96) TaxID=1314807 RepID=A0A4S8MMK3_DENBC|nr:glycoside hydrolase family 61 protein I [Dendrothele bispora CBS 962.96]